MAPIVTNMIKAATVIIDDLARLEINAAVGGSVALGVHEIPRLAAPSDIDLVCFTTDGRTVKSQLLATHPDRYEGRDQGPFAYKHDNEIYKVELLCAGQSASIAWLQFRPEEIQRINLGPPVISLSRLLLSKMSAANTRLRDRRPSHGAKGQRDREDMVSIAARMRDLGQKFDVSLTKGAAGLADILDTKDLALLRAVGVPF